MLVQRIPELPSAVHRIFLGSHFICSIDEEQLVEFGVAVDWWPTKNDMVNSRTDPDEVTVYDGQEVSTVMMATNTSKDDGNTMPDE